MEVQSFFGRYLLFPLVALIATAVLTVWNKKNKLLSNKRLIVGVLVVSLLLGVAGFMGFLDLHFMPWGYIFCQLYYLALGVVFIVLVDKYYQTALSEKKGFVIAAMLIACLLGWYLFYLAFDWVNELKYGLRAGSTIPMFFIPVLFWWTYTALLNIPIDIYKVWQYPRKPLKIDMDHLDFDRLLVLELDLYKKTDDPEPLRVKVKAPENMNFGHWFYKFIEDYNLKFPNSPVAYLDENKTAYKWIFYTKPSFFKRREFIDPDLEIRENRVVEKHTIYAKRVSEVETRSEKTSDEAVFIS